MNASERGIRPPRCFVWGTHAPGSAPRCDGLHSQDNRLAASPCSPVASASASQKARRALGRRRSDGAEGAPPVSPGAEAEVRFFCFRPFPGGGCRGAAQPPCIRIFDRNTPTPNSEEPKKGGSSSFWQERSCLKEGSTSALTMGCRDSLAGGRSSRVCARNSVAVSVCRVRRVAD